ncbi:MAG: hypothetical protein K0S96_528 [Geminicoccaceae bacterium]|nr:hypothetical protein [Geminicoccaceae bacterium]
MAPSQRRDLPRPRRGGWPLRLVGSLFGLGACAIGLFALLGAGGQPHLEQERALGFGLAALVVGAIALVGSLAVRDAHALWYCSPRRWAPFKADVLGEGDAIAAPPSPRPVRRTDDASAGP